MTEKEKLYVIRQGREDIFLSRGSLRNFKEARGDIHVFPLG
jgi:hypothetical protein